MTLLEAVDQEPKIILKGSLRGSASLTITIDIAVTSIRVTGLQTAPETFQNAHASYHVRRMVLIFWKLISIRAIKRGQALLATYPALTCQCLTMMDSFLIYRGLEA